jgi:hypothetical protein
LSNIYYRIPHICCTHVFPLLSPSAPDRVHGGVLITGRRATFCGAQEEWGEGRGGGLEEKEEKVVEEEVKEEVVDWEEPCRKGKVAKMQRCILVARMQKTVVLMRMTVGCLSACVIACSPDVYTQDTCCQHTYAHTHSNNIV